MQTDEQYNSDKPQPGPMDRDRSLPLLRCLRYVWTLPTTAVGLLLVPIALLTGGGIQFIDGVLEVYGGLVRWFLRDLVPIQGGASAMTLGHVVLGADRDALQRTREHERVHVRQAERWGLLFIPAYLLAGAWQRLCGREAYRDNPFEREACARAPTERS